MSEILYSSVRLLLTQQTDLVNLVPTDDIRIGFMVEADNFPCITITQTGGSCYGYLGYGTSAAGSKQRRDNRTFQIDIYSRSGMLDLQQISDKVDIALMSGSGFRKINDNDTYEEGIHAHRKVQTWAFWGMIHD